MIKINKDVVAKYRDILLGDQNSAIGVLSAEQMFPEFISDKYVIISMNSNKDISETLKMLGALDPNNQTAIQASMTPMGIYGELVPLIMISLEDTGMRGDIPLDIFLKSYLVHEITHVDQLVRYGIEKYGTLCTSVLTGEEYTGNVLEKEAFGNQIKYCREHGFKLEFII